MSAWINAQIHITSAMQEMSRNIDTIALAAPASVPDLESTFKLINASQRVTKNPPMNPDNLFNTSLNTGNKSLSSNGISRIKTFFDWAFTSGRRRIV